MRKTFIEVFFPILIGKINRSFSINESLQVATESESCIWGNIVCLHELKKVPKNNIIQTPQETNEKDFIM